MLQAVFYGASGFRYVFNAYSLGTEFHDVGGVYIFTRRSVDQQGAVKFQPLYIGQTESFADRLTSRHEAWGFAVANGFNTICAYTDVDESSRRSSERDLLNNYSTLFNVQHQ